MKKVVKKVNKKVILVNKKEGETPLEALEKFRSAHTSYKNVSMTYAGRLDPMASGVLILLAGDEVYQKEKYLKLDKEYEFEVLFGFATDTYDILGKVIKTAKQGLAEKDLACEVENNLKFFTGKFVQKYPMYSSKTVKGKQLFAYAREGVEVQAPEREVFVKKLNFLKLRTISTKKLLENIEKRISKVGGDFRQKEILKLWHQNLSGSNEQKFFIASFEINCSSGTYVRGVANSLGEKINIPALAFTIKRTKIGKYK